MTAQAAKFSEEEFIAACGIASRAIQMGMYDEALLPLMDLGVVHFSCPLRLNDLLNAAPLDFTHDIRGIQRHLNRETGELEDFFLPRFAQ